MSLRNVKKLLITIAVVLLAGCGKSKKSTPPAESIPVETIAEAANPEAPSISIHDAILKSKFGSEVLKEIYFQMIRQHLAAGTDVNKLNNSRETPLDLAEGEIADFILKNGGKTSVWLRADESIHLAAEAGHIEAVKKHLASGADVNGKDKDELNNGFTPLHHAAYEGHKKLIEIIIASGANINATTTKRGTPLNTAVGMGLIDCVELLINLGANLNEKDGEGWTALHLSSYSGKIDIVKLLIDKGADINAQDFDGETPLNRAENEKEIADLLRKHGGKTGEELKAEWK